MNLLKAFGTAVVLLTFLTVMIGIYFLLTLGINFSLVHLGVNENISAGISFVLALLISLTGMIYIMERRIEG